MTVDRQRLEQAPVALDGAWHVGSVLSLLLLLLLLLSSLLLLVKKGALEPGSTGLTVKCQVCESSPLQCPAPAHTWDSETQIDASGTKHVAAGPTTLVGSTCQPLPSR